MDRRTFLAGLVGGGVGGLAGCGVVPDDTAVSTTPTMGEGQSLAEQGRPPDVCAGDIVDLGIYAIEGPAFAPDWSAHEIPERYAADGRLGADDVVIGIEHDVGTRAYPLAVLWHHEIVNDVVPPADDPVMPTFCSLCRSGMVAERTVGGEVATFGVSGQLWQPPELQTRASEAEDRVFAVRPNESDPGEVRNTGNLVMFDDATGSYWSQILARAICGPREGETLSIVPSTTARWEAWRRANPDTDVLLPPPHSTVQDVPG